jgi:hypothetical protein
MEFPFDNGQSGKYQIELFPAQAEEGDGIVLNADREGFLAFAEVFRQLANSPTETHVHLGYTDDTQPGPGWRLVLGSGRL